MNFEITVLIVLTIIFGILYQFKIQIDKIKKQKKELFTNNVTEDNIINIFNEIYKNYIDNINNIKDIVNKDGSIIVGTTKITSDDKLYLDKYTFEKSNNELKLKYEDISLFNVNSNNIYFVAVSQWANELYNKISKDNRKNYIFSGDTVYIANKYNNNIRYLSYRLNENHGPASFMGGKGPWEVMQLIKQN